MLLVYEKSIKVAEIQNITSWAEIEIIRCVETAETQSLAEMEKLAR